MRGLMRWKQTSPEVTLSSTKVWDSLSAIDSLLTTRGTWKIHFHLTSQSIRKPRTVDAGKINELVQQSFHTVSQKVCHWGTAIPQIVQPVDLPGFIFSFVSGEDTNVSWYPSGVRVHLLSYSTDVYREVAQGTCHLREQPRHSAHGLTTHTHTHNPYSRFLDAGNQPVIIFLCIF